MELESFQARKAYRYLETRRRSHKINSGLNFMNGVNSMVSVLSSQSRAWLGSKNIEKTVIGDVFKISTRGQPILVLSSPQAAFDLLEGRGV